MKRIGPDYFDVKLRILLARGLVRDVWDVLYVPSVIQESRVDVRILRIKLDAHKGCLIEKYIFEAALGGLI